MPHDVAIIHVTGPQSELQARLYATIISQSSAYLAWLTHRVFHGYHVAFDDDVPIIQITGAPN